MNLHWTYEPVIPLKELLLFHNALSHRSESCGYYPVAVAKRSETGIRYRFLCIDNRVKLPGTPSRFLITEIYKPEQGMPYVTRIIPIPIENL